MKHNVGDTDAVVRIVLGMLIWFSGFIFHSWLSMLGLVLVLTAMINFCPLYRLLGINTAKKDRTTTPPIL
jgi:hypothetical protein